MYDDSSILYTTGRANRILLLLLLLPRRGRRARRAVLAVAKPQTSKHEW